MPALQEKVTQYRARRAVVARIEPGLGTVVGAAVQAVCEAIPVYGLLRGPQLADVEAIAYWSMRRTMATWSGGDRTVDERDRSRFRAIGAARAADGRPLTDVLRAYRVASSVFVRHVAEVYLTELDRRDVADLGLVVLEALDAVSEDIIGAYTAARRQLETDRALTHSALLDDLVAGRNTSPGALADRTRALGLRLPSVPNFLIVQSTEVGQPLSEDTVDALVRTLGLTPPDRGAAGGHRSHLCTRRGHRALLLLPSSIGRAEIDDACREGSLRGCLVDGMPLTDVSGAYPVASHALDTAPDHAFDDRAVLDHGDGQLLALLTARPAADTDAVIRTILGPLTENSNQHVLEGLSAFIATGSASAAAARLRVHPQTLRYRLRRVVELTGRNPRLAWHRLALDTAIQLRQLAGPDRTWQH